MIFWWNPPLSEKPNCDRGVIREAMLLKIQDERQTIQELTKERNTWRNDIFNLIGEHRRKYRSVIKYLRGEATKERKDYRIKYKDKIAHLKQEKFEKQKEDLNKVPDGLE
jgi:hypothetical protein